ncbi:PREDICTED: LOC110751684 [Prunus dulcis]|uniref:PREDICTED: LOC110751684 n=1 Tax=Prunus dulcis TaxID=3755 RepID=A0A5E4GE14_PRUDU|nr:PREDICTED: LOC110751684 [Prunus dulcis]
MAEQAPNLLLMADFLHVIELYVTSQDNMNLLAPATDFELECAVKGIGPLKAPGPDGLQAKKHGYANLVAYPVSDTRLDTIRFGYGPIRIGYVSQSTDTLVDKRILVSNIPDMSI